MLEIPTYKELRIQVSNKMHEIGEKFSWEKTAQSFVAVAADLVEKNNNIHQLLS